LGLEEIAHGVTRTGERSGALEDCWCTKTGHLRLARETDPAAVIRARRGLHNTGCAIRFDMSRRRNLVRPLRVWREMLLLPTVPYTR
jgi:hypothetical protein